MDTQPLALRLDQLPLWRLLVALDDAERVAGPDSPTVRVLVREVSSRLSGGTDANPDATPGKGGRRG